jgi:hypothetical protein
LKSGISTIRKATDITLAITAVGSIVTALMIVFLYAPIERTMGIVQKIFYFSGGFCRLSHHT